MGAAYDFEILDAGRPQITDGDVEHRGHLVQQMVVVRCSHDLPFRCPRVYPIARCIASGCRLSGAHTGAPDGLVPCSLRNYQKAQMRAGRSRARLVVLLT